MSNSSPAAKIALKVSSAKIVFCIKLITSHTYFSILIDFSLTVKAATLIFISRRGLAISSAKQGKSGSIYNLVNN